MSVDTAGARGPLRPAIAIEPLLPDTHLETALALSQAAGWLHRAEDWLLNLAIGQGIVALHAGRVVGTAVMAPYGEHEAAIGMVVVDEAMRGAGIGRRLMTAALEIAGPRTVRLVATEAGLPLYDSLGFRPTGRVQQQQGRVAPAASAPNGAVAWAKDVRPDRVAALDWAASGRDRMALYARLAEEARFAILGPADAPHGLAALRPFQRSELVGPVIARSADEARTLIDGVLASRVGSSLRIDVPAESGLGSWLAGRGLVPAGGGIAMERPGPHATSGGRKDDGLRIFALASQALG